MRGKVVYIMCKLLWFRITPAYAGKSQFARRFQQREQDHPRVCGEKQGQQILYHAVVGSPPRMRGKVRPLNVLKQGMLITPAYAGKSPMERSRDALW